MEGRTSKASIPFGKKVPRGIMIVEPTGADAPRRPWRPDFVWKSEALKVRYYRRFEDYLIVFGYIDFPPRHEPMPKSLLKECPDEEL